MAIHVNFVARLQTGCELDRRIWLIWIGLCVLHEDPGLAQVVAHRIDVARQMNGRLHLRRPLRFSVTGTVLFTFTDEVVKLLW